MTFIRASDFVLCLYVLALGSVILNLSILFLGDVYNKKPFWEKRLSAQKIQASHAHALSMQSPQNRGVKPDPVFVQFRFVSKKGTLQNKTGYTKPSTLDEIPHFFHLVIVFVCC